MMPAGPSAASSGLPIASLYVGDLSPDITEAMLFEKFSQIGPVLSIRVCRDVVTRRSLGYAYVNFQTPTDADKAIDTLNFEPIKGDKPMRIMWTQRDPSLRKSGVGNIFIKNLDKSIDNKALYDTFGAFGKILSCKIAQDDKGNSLGYGFVHFEKAESAEASINKLNGKLMNDKQVYVGHFIPKKERDRTTDGKKKFTNLYVKHIREDVSDDDLKQLFAKFGSLSSVYLQKDFEGRSKKFGFVSYELPEDADRAAQEMNGRDDISQVQEGKRLYVAPAKKKAERQTELRDKFEKIKLERASRYQGVNLYIKNLDDIIDDAELRKAFEQFGTVTSAKVMLAENEISRGFGFVCFSNPEEATKAVTEMNGRILKSKPLYVALAQRKEERVSQLSALYNHRTIPGVRIGPGAQLPGIYQNAAAANGAYFMSQIPQRSFFPQMSGTIRQATPRWPASAAQLRPGTQATPAAFQAMPTAHQFRAASAPRASMTQPNIRPTTYPQGPPRMGQPTGFRMPPLQQQQMQTGQMTAIPANQMPQPQRQTIKFTPNARNATTLPPQNMMGLPQQNAGAPNQAMVSEPKRRILLDMPALAKSSPANQKQVLGEHLYPIITELQGAELAGRITGMLLELDNSDLIAMIDAHEQGSDELREKVDEAVVVIKAHAAKEAATASARVAVDNQ